MIVTNFFFQLEMYGFDMSWASFHVLEVMSSAKFQQKRVGYLAAIQSFRTDTDVLMLTTNLLKKDLGSAHPLEISVALSGVASIVTPSLAQDLSDDIIKMLNHSKPYIRKKAILAMYKIFLQFPEALRSSFSRLKDKLSDPDSSVVSATVNVICELAKTNSKNYVELAPALYELLTTSTNNWMLIKILKLFSSLAPTEPRLKSKLLPPILQLIETTTAKSLLYECINCIVGGGMLGPDDYDVAEICVGKLRTFLEESDQNLKFVGLLALSKIIKIHPEFVDSHQDIILECVDDPDLTIRERALEMISGVVTENTIYAVVTRLKQQLTPDLVENNSFVMPRSYRVEVIRKIVEVCSKDMYSLLPDFDWYSSVLVELVQLADGADEVGELIGEQLRDIVVRVREVRDVTVTAALNLVSRQYCYTNMPSVLPPALWIIGEYPSFISSPVEHIFQVAQLIISNAGVSTSVAVEGDNSEALSEVVIIGIQALVKLYAHFVNMSTGWTENRAEVITSLTNKLVEFLEQFSTSLNFEIQERSVEFLELFKLIQEALEEHPDDSTEAPRLLTVAVPAMFNSYELNPVAPGSQWRIAIPEGLDLVSEIYPAEPLSDDDVEEGWDVLGGGGVEPELIQLSTTGEEWKSSVSRISKQTQEELADESKKRRLERMERQKDDPFYISVPSATGTPIESRSMTPDSSSKPSNLNQSQAASLDIDNIPISKLDISGPPVKSRQRFAIIKDEKVEGAIESDDSAQIASAEAAAAANAAAASKKQSKNSAFRIDSSGLANFDLKSPEPEDTAAQEEMDKLRKSLASVATPDDVVAKPKKKKKKSSSTKASAGGEAEKKKKKKKSSSKEPKEPKEEKDLIE